MLIKLKNKDTLEFDDFKFKCCIGKNNTKKNKIEGDKSTPKGTYEVGPVYYRLDRIKKPTTSIKSKIIRKNMIWCTESSSKFYNKFEYKPIINKDPNIKQIPIFFIGYVNLVL